MADYTDPNSGLLEKYVIGKTSGEPLNPAAKYFVLRLDNEGEPNHVAACRKAILVYADEIKEFLPKLSADIIDKYSVKVKPGSNA